MKWHNAILVAVVIAFVTATISFAVASPTAQAQAAQCYGGAYISSSGGHHFVAFNTKNPGHANWVITKKPFLVRTAERVTGKQMNIWGPADSKGEVRAGFPWVDRTPWHYFFTPRDGFTICKK